MKKIIVGLLSIACIALLILIVIRETKKERIDIEIIYVDKLEEEQTDKIQFCAVDKYNNFNLINVEVPTNVDDIYTYVFELYNLKRNSLPLEYTVISNKLLVLNEIKREDDILYIDIQESDIETDELHRIYAALKITYKYLGINQVKITMNHRTI